MKKRLLEIKNLKKNYHTINDEINAIDDLNLEIYENEIVAIVGPSGCGKSTLLSILNNLEKESSGKIIFHTENNNIGYMMQSDSLFPWRNILNNCLIGLEVKKELTKEKMDYVKELLTKYGLKAFMDSYPSNLSGGMKQRVLRILYTHRIITYKWLITLINNGKEVYYVIR